MALPPLSLSLQFADASHRERLPRHKVARWIRAALQHPGEIAVRIVDAGEGRRLNREYRGRDYATNVLTFDYSHEPVVTADLVLCAPVVAERRASRSCRSRRTTRTCWCTVRCTHRATTTRTMPTLA
jgi:probable rRNA maturation factor